MKRIFTDVDGTVYYQNDKGDFVDKHGRLVDLNTEANLRAFCREVDLRLGLIRLVPVHDTN